MDIRSYKTWILVIYVCSIFYLSINSFIFFKNQWKYDVYIHFIEYFILGYLYVNALNLKSSFSDPKLILFFILLFACIDESVQYFTPNRIASIKDVTIDVIGGMAGVFLFNLSKLINNNAK